jgi:RimJ/RimL family protein N-acetyltransferase
MLSSKRLQLVPFTPDKWAVLASWFYDEKYNNLFRHYPRALGQVDFENYPRLINGEVFLIYLKDSLDIVGMCQMIPDTKTNRAFYIGTVINAEYQKNRIPTEAVIIIMDYAFNRLGFKKCIIETLSSDIGLNKNLELTGFTKEGVFEKEVFIKGKFEDENRYAMADEVFNAVNKEVLNGVYLWADSLKS